MQAGQDRGGMNRVGNVDPASKESRYITRVRDVGRPQNETKILEIDLTARHCPQTRCIGIFVVTGIE